LQDTRKAEYLHEEWDEEELFQDLIKLLKSNRISFLKGNQHTPSEEGDAE
jgi:hypothetical protein